MKFALGILTVLITLSGCYRGPSTEDPNEVASPRALPWGTSLAPGASDSDIGLDSTVRHDLCCWLSGKSSAFLVDDAQGSSKLYLDVYASGDSPVVTLLVGPDKNELRTPALPSGPTVIMAAIDPKDIVADGTVPVTLTSTTRIGLFGVYPDQKLADVDKIILKVVEAK